MKIEILKQQADMGQLQGIVYKIGFPSSLVKCPITFVRDRGLWAGPLASWLP